MKVCKFGGSSVASAAQIRKVADIVKSDPQRKIVVVSAPGKRHAEDIKVTDLLIKSASSRLKSGSENAGIEGAVARFEGIQRELEITEDLGITEDLRSRFSSDSSNHGKYMDLLKAAGEDSCAKIVAAHLRNQGIAARYVNPADAGMLLSAEYGNAVLLPESYEKLAKLADLDDVIVFPGFFGVTPDGDVVTFPRGGSDITGSILAAAVKAEVYENFTDVDSVFPVDPRIVPGVKESIHEMTYREMRELSYAGFAVFHDEAIQPAIDANIPINILNTNAPELPGTKIVPVRDVSIGSVTGIASDDGFCTVYVSKYLMNREVGFGRRLLQVFEEEGVSYEHTPSGIDSMSVVIRDRDFDDATALRVMERIREELAADEVSLERGQALIMIVGEGMHYTVGLAARATSAFAEAGVSLEMINQGSSEISMMFGVSAAQRVDAVRSLYKAFFMDK